MQGSGRSLLLIGAGALAALLIPSLFYVWGHTQIVSDSYGIESGTQRLRELRDEARILELRRAQLASLDRIEKRARSMGLRPAGPDRIIVVNALVSTAGEPRRPQGGQP
jgi:hypothetical protein